MNKLNKLTAALLLISGLYACSPATEKVVATDEVAPADILAVTEANYEIAESDFTFNGVVGVVGTNKWMAEKGLTPIDKQKVVRQNRDTIYSYYVADVSEGATVTVPETPDGRYISVMVVQNDHYIDQVFINPGTYKVESQTDFAAIVARVQVNPFDPNDMEVVRDLQSKVTVENPSKREKIMPNWDLDQMVALRNKLVEEGQKFGSLNNMQGKHGEVDSRMHLLGTALGWGLLPDENARYLSFFPEGEIASPDVCSKATYSPPLMNEGGFYSITVYGGDGYAKHEQSILNRYNLTYNADGTFTAHFGNCPEGTPNHVMTAEGWNFLFRVYEPVLAELDKFELPVPEPVK